MNWECKLTVAILNIMGKIYSLHDSPLFTVTAAFFGALPSMDQQGYRKHFTLLEMDNLELVQLGFHMMPFSGGLCDSLCMFHHHMATYGRLLSGWWYTYPSEKYESQLG